MGEEKKCPRGFTNEEAPDVFLESEKELKTCNNVHCPYLFYADGIYGCMINEEE